MKRFFMYLDRYYVKHHDLPSISKACLQSFKRIAFGPYEVLARAAMLDIINDEREEAAVNIFLIAQCADLFEAMGSGLFVEEHLLNNARQYYARKSQVWIDGSSTPDYLRKAEKGIEEEKTRSLSYFKDGLASKLLAVFTQEVLEKRFAELCYSKDSGLSSLINNNQADDIACMYRLYSRSPECLSAIEAVVKQHISDEGNAIINKWQGQEDLTSEDPSVVIELLALHHKYTSMISSHPQSKPIKSKALDEAFGEFVNRDVAGTKIADLMSMYCYDILKKGGNGLTDGEVEEFVSRVIVLFTYLADKDVFIERYRQQLAKRLLTQRSAPGDANWLMISKLKLLMGSHFTSKLEGMMHDIKAGEEDAAAFSENFLARTERHGLHIDFLVQVLGIGHWPTFNVMNVTLPPEMLKCVAMFAEFYKAKHNKHRLTWMHGHGSVTVKAHYPSGKSHDFEVSTLQAAAMMIFSASEVGALTLDAIVKQLNLPLEIVKKVVHSLSMRKYKILSRRGEGTSLKLTDTFCFNEKFSSPFRKLHVQMPSLEEDVTMKRVEEDRGAAIEAAIVRIMKARQLLDHQQLVAEVLAQLNAFNPDPKRVKSKIESLIDREYLERDKEAPNTYKYLA